MKTPKIADEWPQNDVVIRENRQNRGRSTHQKRNSVRRMSGITEAVKQNRGPVCKKGQITDVECRNVPKITAAEAR